GQEGFEELRKYVKQGGEFCKEVASIIQERADLETTYAKSLSKLGKKLTNASAGTLGSLSDGWKTVAVAMEQEAELHKNLASGLYDDISKPLKTEIEQHTKSRKPIEAMVEKSLKTLTDRRTEEYKAKKAAFSCAKDYEKAEDTEIKSGKAKDVTKVGSVGHSNEKKCKQTRDLVKKADKEYTDCCYKAETARLDWDYIVKKCSSSMQQLEEERLRNMEHFLNKYNGHMTVIGPKIIQICDRLNESVISVDVNNDLRIVVQQKGVKGPRQQDQILLDCYAEDSQFAMKAERRRNALQNYLLYLHAHLERDRKGKEGTQTLMDVYKSRPNFGDADAQQEVIQNLEKITYTLNFLEASHYKISKCLAKQDQRTIPTHKFGDYIETTRDKQMTLQASVLQAARVLLSAAYFKYDPHCKWVRIIRERSMPRDLALEGNSEYSYSAGSYSGSTEGYYSEVDNRHDDSFSSEEEDYVTIGRCKVLYDYSATRGDEISIKTGEIINIYEKQTDGWWKGELQGKVGIFPSTYIEEIDTKL
ncbi:hypothetical protein LOTGIDRAFT_129539, partial [Lottia gigantea]